MSVVIRMYCPREECRCVLPSSHLQPLLFVCAENSADKCSMRFDRLDLEAAKVLAASLRDLTFGVDDRGHVD